MAGDVVHGVYGVILADPPWPFATYSRKGKGRSAEAHFPSMPVADIAALRVADWAERDSVLYLWATVPHLPSALAVMAAWGFGYKSAFVWIKDRSGTGYWARNRHEHLLVGARGPKVCPRFRGIEVRDSVIAGQQRGHSHKPDRVVEIIESYHPTAAKLEMFARETRPGWDAWGDQVGLFDGGPVPTRRWPSSGPGVGRDEHAAYKQGAASTVSCETAAPSHVAEADPVEFRPVELDNRQGSALGNGESHG
jgi:N6-adenosine-specific RNA methylase IME4